MNVIDTVGDVGKYSVLIVDDRAQVHVAYLETLGGDSAIVYHNELSAGVWLKQAVDTVTGVSNSSRKPLSLQKGSKGELHLVCGTDHDIRYYQQKGSGWVKDVIFDVNQHTASSLGGGVGFKLDSHDSVHVVFFEQDSTSFVGWKSRYMTNSTMVEPVSNKKIENSKVAVYPNPFHSDFFINGVVSGDEVRIFNVYGQLIYSGKGDGGRMKIHLGGASDGIYILRVPDKSGHSTSIKLLKK